MTHDTPHTPNPTRLRRRGWHILNENSSASEKIVPAPVRPSSGTATTVEACTTADGDFVRGFCNPLGTTLAKSFGMRHDA